MGSYGANSTGICPHCGVVVVFDARAQNELVVSANSLRNLPRMREDQGFRIYACVRPACARIVIGLEVGLSIEGRGWTEGPQYEEYLVWPRSSNRIVPPEVPGHVRADYDEAAIVLHYSAKASAALSRRCLQTILREAGHADQHNLVDQIKAVLPGLPSYLADQIDAIRHIGNFAAHPNKRTSTGQLMEVEPGEAEWNLDVVDLLFGFYYVQPAIADAKKKAVNSKLAESGQKPIVDHAS